MDRKSPPIGIHLGWTHACVAVRKHGRVQAIPDEQGNSTTPLVVAFNQDACLIGDLAMNQMASNSANTVYDMMHLIRYRSNVKLLVQEDWPFQVVAGPDGYPAIIVQYRGEKRMFSLEEILAIILTKMREVAQSFLGAPVRDAVVTIPWWLYRDRNQEHSLLNKAAMIAGINVLRFFSEEVVAAVPYGLDKTVKLLVFNFGSRHLEVAKDDVCTRTHIRMIPVLFDEDKFSSRIVNYFAQKFQTMHGMDITSNARAMEKLRNQCRRAKRSLFNASTTSIRVDRLYNDVDFTSTISRNEFEDLCFDIFANCLSRVKNCLEAAWSGSRGIEEVLLVGESARMPKIQEMLKNYLNHERLCMSINPEEVVAHGAAIEAAKLTGFDDERLPCQVLLNAVPTSIGIETWCGEMTVIVPRGVAIPVTKQLVIGVDNQSSMKMRVFQGEGTKTSENQLLGVLEFHEIEVTPERKTRINVDFSIDENLILLVSAENETGERKESLSAYLTYFLSPQ